MSQIILLDDKNVRLDLLPLSFTRPVSEFRIGITTIRDKWELLFSGDYSYQTVDYLSEKFPVTPSINDDTYIVASNIIPTAELVEKIKSMPVGVCYNDKNGDFIAMRGSMDMMDSKKYNTVELLDTDFVTIRRPYDIFMNNGKVIVADFNLMVTTDSPSQPLDGSNRIIGPTHDADGRPMVFLANGAKAYGATFNTTNGPIYLGPGAEVMEGSCLRGPVAIGTHATVNMGSKIYPATTIGPWSKVGGELNNVVIFGFSNKAHDGFLGNAVIGEWCNLGAGCTASNLKNDYSNIRLWNYRTESFERTAHQFCGLIMGDHSKAGINTMFNTATVAGVGVNVYGAGFPRTFIASFSQGGALGFNDVPLTKFYDMASRMMARRGCELSDADRRMFEAIYNYAHQLKK